MFNGLYCQLACWFRRGVDEVKLIVCYRRISEMRDQARTNNKENQFETERIVKGSTRTNLILCRWRMYEHISWFHPSLRVSEAGWVGETPKVLLGFPRHKFPLSVRSVGSNTSFCEAKSLISPVSFFLSLKKRLSILVRCFVFSSSLLFFSFRIFLL
jgi:hypothetical protein